MLSLLSLYSPYLYLPFCLSTHPTCTFPFVSVLIPPLPSFCLSSHPTCTLLLPQFYVSLSLGIYTFPIVSVLCFPLSPHLYIPFYLTSRGGVSQKKEKKFPLLRIYSYRRLPTLFFFSLEQFGIMLCRFSLLLRIPTF